MIRGARTFSTRGAAIGLLIGSFFPLVIFIVIWEPWETPLQPWQDVLALALLPGGITFGVLASMFGHTLDLLSDSLAQFALGIIVLSAFFVQSAVLGVLIAGLWRKLCGRRWFADEPRV